MLESERAYYEAAARQNAEADRPPRPEMSADQKARLNTLRLQAQVFMEQCPDLRKWLDDQSMTRLPFGQRVSATEAALYHRGWTDCLRVIRHAAESELEEPSDG